MATRFTLVSATPGTDCETDLGNGELTEMATKKLLAAVGVVVVLVLAAVAHQHGVRQGAGPAAVPLADAVCVCNTPWT